MNWPWKLLVASVLAASCLMVTGSPAHFSFAQGQTQQPYAREVRKSYQFPFGSLPFLPSQAQTESGDFISPDFFLPASYCAHCHQDVHQQWRQSAHANSFREPFYLRNVEMLIKDKGIESSRHCEGCHNPIALFSGALTTGSKMARPFDQDGVTCMVCHSISKIQNTSGTGSYVMGIPAVMLKPDGTPMRGRVSYSEILTRPDLHSRAVMRDFYRTPEFCAACHKAAVPRALNNYRWLRAFTVYDEWQESSWSTQSLAPFYKKEKPSTCQNCHMLPVVAASDYGAKHGMVASHRWLGANTAIPTFYNYSEQLQKTKDFLKEAVNIDIFGIEKADGQLIAPIEKERFTLAASETVTVNVVLQNARVGHSFVPEQRDFYESWVEFRVTDAGGNTIYHSGFLDQKGFVDPRAHSYTNRLVSSSRGLLDLHQVWETRIKAYDNAILPGRSDLVRYRFRIPANVRGPLMLSARLNYRRFRKGYTNFVLPDRPAYPIAEIASRTMVLKIGDNGGDAAPDQKEDYLRWNNYGIALLTQAEYYKAAQAFKKVVALNPDYVDGYTNIGIASYTELTDHKREGADGLGAVDLALGGAPDGTGNLFLARARAEAFEPALHALDQALAIDPSNLRARFHKGVIRRLQKRFDLAVELLTPVVAAYPRFRQARQEMGYAYFVTKQFQLAREQFEALQPINPDDITANYYLSYIYDQLGMKGKAEEQARLFSDRKADVEVEPVALEFWEASRDLASELARFHVHEDASKLSNRAAAGGTSPRQLH
jgi:tetratricopeptide (TPR) repeat protein